MGKNNPFLVLVCLVFLLGCSFPMQVTLALPPILQGMPTLLTLPSLTSTPTSSLTPFQPQADTPTAFGPVSETPSATFTETILPTLTETTTPLSTASLTPSLSPTASLTASISPFPSRTDRFSFSLTPSKTRTPSRTPTRSLTQTASNTATMTFTPSLTGTTTETPTITETLPPTASLTASNTFTPSLTFTQTDTPTETSTRTDTPIPSPTITVAGCSPVYNAGFEDRVVSLINAQRVANGLPALIVRSQITAAARNHSMDMACNNYFSHIGLDGSTSRDRMLWEGWPTTWAGENIYGGQMSTADSVVTWWMNSTPHRTNILNVNYTSIGVGFAATTNSMYQKYWTANFAQP